MPFFEGRVDPLHLHGAAHRLQPENQPGLGRVGRADVHALRIDLLLAGLARHFEGGLGVGDDIQIDGIGLARHVDVVAGRAQFLGLGRDHLLLAVAVVV